MIIRPIEPEITLTQKDMQQLEVINLKDNVVLLRRISEEIGVPYELASYIADHESNYGYDPKLGDMDIVCPSGPNKGKPVRAKGILQITDCYYPKITDAQAFNVEWSLRWGLPQMLNKRECVRIWSTCNDYYNRKTI